MPNTDRTEHNPALLRRLVEFMDSRAAPGDGLAQQTIHLCKTRVLLSCLLILLLLGTGLFAAGVIKIVSVQAWNLIAIYSVPLALLICLTFIRGIDFSVRVASLLFIMFIAGVFSLQMGGLASSGRVWLLTCILIAAILAGFRTGLAFLGVSTAALAVFGWLTVQGEIGSAQMLMGQSLPWLLITANFFALGLMSLLSVSMVVSGLNASLDNEKRLFSELHASKQQLQKANEKLMEKISERQQAEKALEISESKYKELFEHAALGILMIDKHLNILDANTQALEMLGYSLPELQQLNATDLVHHDDLLTAFLPASFRKRESGEVVNVELRYRTKQGQDLPVELSLKSMQGDDMENQLLMFRDVSERKRFESTLFRMAYYDGLTGLPNRQLLLDRLGHSLSRAKRTGMKVAVMFVDMDRLKLINDTLGHAAGDTLIREVGKRLQEILREKDTVARVGGDEFMCLIEDLESTRYTMHLGMRLKEEIGKPCWIYGIEIVPQCSIGMSVYPDNALDSETLLKQADIAMYNAKRSNSNKVQRYNEDEDWISKRFYMEQELRQAMDRSEFALHYHPLVELESFRVIGLEALLRWRHPERGIVMPDEFLPVLEETGLIEPVGQWVLQTACSQIKAWQKRGWPLIYVSINLSSRQLHNPDFVKAIDRVLGRFNLDPFYLGLELTENIASKNSEAAMKTLNTLSEKRVRILLDDFGKNGSSLKSLRHFSIDTVKICRSFVRDLPENKENAAITEAIIAMAHALGKTVLAEGVTSRREADFLRQKGCDYAQGFLFGKPFPAKKIGEGRTRATLRN